MTADGFGSLKFAARLRAVVREMVQAELARQGTPARGTVVEINDEARVAQIALPGAEESVPIALTGDARPAVAGAVVEIVGPPGNRRIGSVISDPRPEWNGGNVPDSGGEDDGDGGVTGGPATPTGLTVANNSASFSIALSWNENTEVDMINGFGRYEIVVNLMLLPGQQEIQTLTITGTGTYKIVFGGYTTSEAIPHDAPASEVSRIFTDLASVGPNDVEITGTPGNYTFKWLRTLGNVAQPTTSNLVGVSAATFATTQAGSADLDLSPGGVDLTPTRVTANTLFAFAAPQNFKFKFKIRAVDAHGRASDWTAWSDTVEVLPVRAIHIDPLSITETHISPDSIRSPMIQAETIQGNNIAARTIEAMHIAANSITADEITSSLILVNQSIQSTSYDPGNLGWAIIDDGVNDLAEFNNLLARGEISTGDDNDPHVKLYDDPAGTWGVGGGTIEVQAAGDDTTEPLSISVESSSPYVYYSRIKGSRIIGGNASEVLLHANSSYSLVRTTADRIQHLGAIPGVLLTMASFSLTNGASTQVTGTFTEVDGDPWAIHASGTVTVPHNGIWVVSCAASFPDAAGGNRRIIANVGGTEYEMWRNSVQDGTNDPQTASASQEFKIVSGQTVKMHLFQNKDGGGSMTVTDIKFSVRQVSTYV